MHQHTEQMSELDRKLIGWTPFPNVLLDRVMPKLTDTEFRVLCIIVRQTYGWKEGEHRRRSDWITHSQFKKRSGRKSSAVSKAVDVLERSGIIQVRDEDAQLLHSATERRRSRSRLYYSLTPVVIFPTSQLMLKLPIKRIPQSRNNNNKPNERKTTTENAV